MKLKRGYLFLLFILIVFSNVMEVNAINTGFKTNHLTIEEKNTFITNINFLLLDEEPEKKSITCFDVNNKKLIAIGQNTPNRKTICIYSCEGVFQYGYSFNCSGTFGVEWDEDNLNIYFIRSSVIISVSPSGEILDVVETQNIIENSLYVNHFIHATERTIGDTEYFITNNMGILNFFVPSYSQIIVKDVTGAESVIYDVGAMQLSKIIVTIVIVFVFLTITIGVVGQSVRLKRKN